MRPPQAGERPNGRRANWRTAERPEGAPAIEARKRHASESLKAAVGMRGDTLIVFARAPRLGAVKRRLARGIGAMGALRFHRGQLAVLLGAVARDRRWRTVLAFTPDRARARWPRRVKLRAQGHGDLGARMGRAMRRHRRVVLVGCDIPGIGRDDIAAAFRALGRASAVFGPAEDGGYWLVGLGPLRPARPFGEVRWSTEHTLTDTLANFQGRRVALLRRLRDVDTAEDLAALKGPAR